MFEKMISKLYLLPILVQERSVTKAAEKVFVTQAAMSQLLRDLRIYLKDPVLIRNGNKMEPTERAVQLSSTVEQFFGDLKESMDHYFQDMTPAR